MSFPLHIINTTPFLHRRNLEESSMK